MEALYAHYPGLIVMTPATVEDAYSMLLEAVAIDDPVIFCEHKYLYNHLKADRLPTEAMPTGKARIARAGRDMTLVAYSALVHDALAVAEELASALDRTAVLVVRWPSTCRRRHFVPDRRPHRDRCRRRSSTAASR